MKPPLIQLSLFLSCLFLITPLAHAGADHLLIVEIQIAGEKSSDDFIKIYNPFDSDIFLKDYKLAKRTKNGVKDYLVKSWSKEPEAKIPALGFYLWANSGYKALTDIDSFTSQIVSPDNGIALKRGEEIIDALGWGNFNNVFFEKTAFPKNPPKNQKLERKKTGEDYQDTGDNGQDFYLKSTEADAPLKPTDQAQIEPDSVLQEQALSEILRTTEAKNYPEGIVINEIFPYSQKSDELNEWIELLNKNNFEVDLSNWKVQDINGATASYALNAKISPNGFLVLPRPTTKIILNNNKDGLSLVRPDGAVIETINYENAPKEQSYSRFNDGWKWTIAPTPKKENVFSVAENKIKKEKISVDGFSYQTLIQNNRQINENENKEAGSDKNMLAGIKEQIPSSPNPLFILIVAIGIAVFGGMIILLLKNRLAKNEH